MATTWETKITPIDKDEFIVSIDATGTDDAPGSTPITVRVSRAPIQTMAQKIAVRDEIKVKYDAKLALVEADETFITAQEAALKAALEALN